MGLSVRKDGGTVPVRRNKLHSQGPTQSVLAFTTKPESSITITINKLPKRQRTRNPQTRPLGLPLPTRRTLTQPNPDWGITTRTPPKRQPERKGHTPKNYPAHTKQKLVPLPSLTFTSDRTLLRRHTSSCDCKAIQCSQESGFK